MYYRNDINLLVVAAIPMLFLMFVVVPSLQQHPIVVDRESMNFMEMNQTIDALQNNNTMLNRDLDSCEKSRNNLDFFQIVIISFWSIIFWSFGRWAAKKWKELQEQKKKEQEAEIERKVMERVDKLQKRKVKKS